MTYGLRAQLGRVAAYAAGVLLAFGPSYLYFSRFAREDIYIAAITMAMLVVTFRFLDVPAALAPGGVRRAAGAQLRHQGVDVHHDLRGRHASSWSRSRGRRAPAAAARGAGRAHAARRRAGSRTRGASPRSWRSTRSLFTDVPHAPERHLRALDGPRLLARPARRRPRRRGAGLLRRSCCSRTSGRCCCSAPSGRSPRSGARRCCGCSSCGRSCSRSPSTRGRARSSPGWCCTRCCR